MGKLHLKLKLFLKTVLKIAGFVAVGILCLITVSNLLLISATVTREEVLEELGIDPGFERHYFGGFVESPAWFRDYTVFLSTPPRDRQEIYLYEMSELPLGFWKSTRYRKLLHHQSEEPVGWVIVGEEEGVEPETLILYCTENELEINSCYLWLQKGGGETICLRRGFGGGTTWGFPIPLRFEVEGHPFRLTVERAVFTRDEFDENGTPVQGEPLYEIEFP